MRASLFVVDDDPSICVLMERVLTKRGYDVQTCRSGEEAIKILSEHEFDIVLIDLYLQGDMSGFGLMSWLNENKPHIIKIVLSGTTRIQDVVEAVHRGAYDFILKPIDSWDVCIHQIDRAIEHKRIKEYNEQLLLEIQQKNTELENRLAELELAYQLVQAQTEMFQQDLRRAERIQRALLPKIIPRHQELSASVYYQPLNRIGGDLFDIFQLDENRIGVYIADTSGHGIGSALVTTFLKYAFQPKCDLDRGGYEIITPKELLKSLNEKLVFGPFGYEMFMSLCYAIIDFQKKSIEVCNAGHPSILWRHQSDNSIEIIRVPAPALGIVSKANFTSMTFSWDWGDTFLFYTDGIVNLEDPSGEKFDQQKLTQLLQKDSGNPQEMVRLLEEQTNRWTQHKLQKDDMTLIWLTLKGQDKETIVYYPAQEPILSSSNVSTHGILHAIKVDTCYLKIIGIGTWREAYGLNDFLQKLKEERKDIKRWVFDFKECTQLESTFFGVLHQLCYFSEQGELPQISLQNISQSLLKEFSELGLADTLIYFSFEPEPLPSELSPITIPTPQGRMVDFILNAHEVLVTADPNNAPRFAQLISLLKEEQKK
ncbi:MAG TPA: SpoIIE family protein phosphatase [Candidatus Hydrogenedens sp.]|nr:SpoIIE family protein phosphatase [Candidatus Hydrogenedens sp.]HOL18978.1 SpoIIE family protein phosphatase [Candidatus Hydrogenedens sp.]HPP58970.1 SpoIIE family protein phosphatase [Candidatus Hydrogenedens sp.]